MAFSFIIPGAPVAWKRPRQAGARRFNDAGVEAYKARVAGIAGKAWGPRAPLFCPVELSILAIFPIPAAWPKALRGQAEQGLVFHDDAPDLSNVVKAAEDALFFICYVDDRQIARGEQVARYGLSPRVEVRASALPGLPTPAALSREKKWRAGGYDAAICTAPCGMASLPRLLAAAAKVGLI